MYPLNTAAPWPANQWYIAAFSSEVTRQIMARTYLNRRVVLFRDEAGTAHALSGLCPHRMMPLELGSLAGDQLVCGYHGLTFNTDGLCVASPASKSVPKCALSRFPLKEAGPLIWIWMGAPELAQSVPLPAQEAIGIGCPGWLTQCVQRYLLKARYALLIDNLFDLSHLGFVHASIVGAGGIALEVPKIEEREGRLAVSRTLYGVPTDNYHRFLYPHMGPRMTVNLSTELFGISLINAGGPAYDGADTNAPVLGRQNFIHALTPETEGSTHYWLLMTRDFRQDDAQLSSALAAQNVAVVEQDRTVLESIEKQLSTGVDVPREISMPPDAGALRARLRVMRMIQKEEHAQSEVAASKSAALGDHDPTVTLPA